MVVHFTAAALQDLAPDARHPVKKKYLAARSREKKNSIFDYVHLSSKLLRQVRYGQSLDAAMQLKSPWGNNERDCHGGSSSNDPGSGPTRHSLSTIWRTDASTETAAAPSPSSRPLKKSSNQHLDKLHHKQQSSSSHGIHFGKEIQLQATDGGFLAVDRDGAMIKLPKSHHGDPRTLLTLFPQDPLYASGTKARVKAGDQCFLVLGSATITTHHDVLYADAKKFRSPPPVALQAAVKQHQRDHADSSASRVERHGTAAAAGGGSAGAWTAAGSSLSRTWCFQTTATERDGDRVLVNGMVVQLMQQERALHYEMEKIVKHKYTPITTAGPETMELEAPSPATQSSSSSSGGANSAGNRNTPTTTHVWLQQNNLSSQSESHRSTMSGTTSSSCSDVLRTAPTLPSSSSAKRKKWDNLWFLIDVAAQRRRDHDQKKRLAVLEAQEEHDANTNDDDADERLERPESDRRQHLAVPPRRDPLSRVQEDDERGEDDEDDEDHTTDRSAAAGSANNTGRKRISVLNARVFVSRAAEETQHHAANIILRFLRRVSHQEAQRRARDLIERRIRRRTMQDRPKNDSLFGDGLLELSTKQQLRVLQCFKPSIYGSQRIKEPVTSPSRTIPGISLQGSKYPVQEAHRLASMARDLNYLGSGDFRTASSHINNHHHHHHHPHQQHQLDSIRRQASQSSPLVVSNGKARQNMQIANARERDHHVQVVMAHHEKPPFRFGKPTTVHLASQHRHSMCPASPSVKL